MDEFQGAIIAIANGRIIGWAWRPLTPQTRLSVEVWLGARLLGQSEATLYDPALEANGIGDGRYGFQFQPPALPQIEFPATLFCRVVGADFYLPGSLRINSRDELSVRFGGQIDDSTMAPRQVASPEPVQPPQAAAQPMGGAVPGAAAGLDALNVQLNRLRDSLGQALLERLEAQLTILRDEMAREMQVLRQDLAALAARVGVNNPAPEPPVDQPIATFPPIEMAAPVPQPLAATLEMQDDDPIDWQDFGEPMPLQSPEPALPREQQPFEAPGSVSETPSSMRQSPPGPSPALPSRPLRRAGFAPLPGQRPISRPLPGRGIRHPGS